MDSANWGLLSMQVKEMGIIARCSNFVLPLSNLLNTDSKLLLIMEHTKMGTLRPN